MMQLHQILNKELWKPQHFMLKLYFFGFVKTAAA